MATYVSVWIDHKEARIFHVHLAAADHLHREIVDATRVHAPQHHIHRHPKGHSGEAAPHPEDSKHFFDQVAHTLQGADAILIVGPASAKTELFKHLREHHAPLSHRVIGLETVDHPTDPQIVAMAKAAFAALERGGRRAIDV